jgi:pyruvate dehydrogenase E2 component (dihydrolipoamide acetyltransferase)
MAEVIRMPRMSDTMTEGVIAAWVKKVGDKVKAGDVLAEVETDKATMELESYNDGVLLYIGVEEGESVEVEGILAVIGDEGEDFKDLLRNEKTENSNKQNKEEEVTISKSENNSEISKGEAINTIETNNDNRLKASPLAKKIASENNIDLHNIVGSGDSGRIIKKDIESALNLKSDIQEVSESKFSNTIVAQGHYEDVNLSQMRKTIARRLAESKFSAPHFYLTIEVNLNKTIDFRTQLNQNPDVKISFNDIVIKAVASALRKHPNINSSWMGDKIRKNYFYNIGVAVAVDEGLMVPVLKNADSKSLTEISKEVKELGEKARNKKLSTQEMEGNTFTISNLGMFGIEEFTAIINPPDACILAVGGIKKVPGFDSNNEIIPLNLMKLTLSCDHRVVDGATGALFLQTLKGMLENPINMLL